MTDAVASFARFFGRIPKAVLFGAAILVQVALLAAMVFAEKLAPPAWHASRWLAAALVAGAAYVLIA
jgi:hypothetical protein